MLAATVGWYMVLRRQSFSGHTLSVMAFPGAAGAALVGLPTALGYYLACGGAAAAMAGRARATAAAARPATRPSSGPSRRPGLPLGYLFLSLDHAILGGPETLLFGTVLGVTRTQVYVTPGRGRCRRRRSWPRLIARPLLFASVDAEVADARGVPVRLLDAGFLLILGIAVAATSQITGALLVFALLVAPPASRPARDDAPAARSLAARDRRRGARRPGSVSASPTSAPWPVGFYTTTFAAALYVLTWAVIRHRSQR